MVPLRKLTLADKQWMEPIVLAEHTHSADFCFGNMFIWDEEYDQRVGEYQGRIIALARCETNPFFAFPVGSGGLKPVLEEMHCYARENGFPFTVSGVTEEHKSQMETCMPGQFTFTPMEMFFDYVYRTDALADLAGKKLHGKRNHIHRFETLWPDWRYEAMTPEHFPACLDLLRRWQAERDPSVGAVEEEECAIARAFAYFDPLGLEGGVLFVKDRLCAFTVGEQCAEDTYLIHFEKADGDVEGAYPMINREFARQIRQRHPAAVYINREDDMGLESLRKSKRSYYPEFQVIKYNARWVGETG